MDAATVSSATPENLCSILDNPHDLQKIMVVSQSKRTLVWSPKYDERYDSEPQNDTHNFGNYGWDQGTLGVHSDCIIKGLGGGRGV